jgi:hypothetical protein
MESPAGWMMAGSIREDDEKFRFRARETPPQDDPSGNIDRPLNHFYDLHFDIPLWAILQFGANRIPLGNKTPEWAIEGKDKDGQHRNHFSIKDAKEAMFRAATLRTLENGQLKPLQEPVYGSFYGLTEEGQRRAYWATVFKSLGNVLHLLQDMQPQHCYS